MAAEDFAEDFFLVVELESISLGFIEGLLEFPFLLVEEFLEDGDLFDIFLSAGSILH